MKTQLLKILIVGATIFLLQLTLSPILLGQDRELVILHTNDSHGRIYPVVVRHENPTSQLADPGAGMNTLGRTGEIGGFAALATAIQQLRHEFGEENILLVDGGDSFADGLLGQLTRGEASIGLMNQLGYEFMALGNHDFDFGKKRTSELQDIALFPMRGLNVIDEDTGQPFLGQPWAIIEKAGIRVGLIAIGYRNTHLTTGPDNVRGLRFEDSKPLLSPYIRELRDQVDLLVALSHEGLDYDKELARDHPELDLIIGGHSHDFTSEPLMVGNTRIVQAFSHLMALGVTKVSLNQQGVAAISSEIQWLWHDQVLPDRQMAETIREISLPWQDTLNAVVGYANTPIPRNYKSASPFDFMLGDILMQQTGSQLALLPGVGYGIAINHGPIKRMDLCALIPHDNQVVTLELQGRQILEILEQSAWNQHPDQTRDEVGGIIQTPGMQWEADLRKPAGNRISGVMVNGEPLDENQWYHVVTHEGMLQGLHRYETIARGRNISHTGNSLLQLLEDHMADNPVEAPETPMIINQ